MSGVVEKIKLYPAKGKTAIEPDEACLVENQGIKGDYHAQGGERQVSLLMAECLDMPLQLREKALCFSRFKGNITIRGLRPEALLPGSRLLAGEAVIEITGETKHCHEECELFEAGKACTLAGQNLFAKVRKSGLVRAGDKITVNEL
jgi:TatD DNase family protein